MMKVIIFPIIVVIFGVAVAFFFVLFYFFIFYFFFIFFVLWVLSFGILLVVDLGITVHGIVHLIYSDVTFY